MKTVDLERRKQFATAMIFYARVLPNGAPDFTDQAVLSFWYSQLGNVGFDALRAALDYLCASLVRFPAIAQVRDRLGIGELGAADKGRGVAGLILVAIGKFGEWQPREAEAFLGPVGWQVVQLQGGWREVCQVTNRELPIKQAQWRDLAETIAARGVINSQAVGLPGNAGEVVSDALREICAATKTIGKGRNA